MSLIQPLTIEVIPQLNENSRRYQRGSQFEYYDVNIGSFVTVDDIRAHFIPFPPDHIPVFRLRGRVPLLAEQNRDLGGSLARGQRQVGPMCSMKGMFMEYTFLWPAGLLYPRKYLKARWYTVARGSIAGMSFKQD